MRILILGGNGMIGHKIYQLLSEDFPDTWAMFRQKIELIPFNNIFNKNNVIDNFDFTNFDKLKYILDKINPDVIINAAGITIRRGINDSLSRTILTNSVLPHFLGEWVQDKVSKRLIHFSTDCVFSGKTGPYMDNSVPDATDNYGRTKALGEVNMTQTLTLRGSMIGRELQNHTELLEWFLTKKGNVIKGYTNVFYSGISTIRMAKYVKKVINSFPNLSGIYNVSSSSISKYELLVLFNETFNTDVKIIKDETFISKKILISNRFYTEIEEIIPQWQDLIVELYNDSNLNNNFYKK
jgi:dTDP-4-dehydrorhamnose reductase